MHIQFIYIYIYVFFCLQAHNPYVSGTNIRSVSKEEVLTAQEDYKSVLKKIVANVQASSSKVSKEKWDRKHNFPHALAGLSNDVGEDIYGNDHIVGEIHQILKHGHDAITGALCWIFYSLYRNTSVRAKLEEALSSHKSTELKPYPDYLEWVLLETFRR